MYLRAPLPLQRKQLTRAFRADLVYERTRIAAIRLDWTTVILNSTETSGPSFQMVGHLGDTSEFQSKN